MVAMSVLIAAIVFCLWTVSESFDYLRVFGLSPILAVRAGETHPVWFAVSAAGKPAVLCGFEMALRGQAEG